MASDRKRLRILEKATRQTKEIMSLFGEQKGSLVASVENIAPLSDVVDSPSRERQYKPTCANDFAMVEELRADESFTLSESLTDPSLTVSNPAENVRASSPVIASASDGICAAEPTAWSQEDFCRQLRTWAVSHRVHREALGDLLKILKGHACHASLPADARTLLKTRQGPCSEIPITDLSPGQYCHYDFERGLLHTVSCLQSLPKRWCCHSTLMDCH